MKKFNAKLVVSALAAAMMLSASSVAVSAYDYGPVTPGGNTPAAPTTSTTTAAATTGDVDGNTDGGTPSSDDTTVAASSNVVTEEVVDAAIEAALKAGEDEITIAVAEDPLTGKVIVQESALAAIVEAGVEATFEVTPALGVSYEVTIDPDTIRGDISKLNIGMTILAGPDVSLMAAQLDLPFEVPADTVVIAPQMKGDFGLDLTITIPASALADANGEVHLYYISDEGLIELLDDDLVVNTDGSVSVTLSHASAYVLTSEDLASFDIGGYFDEEDDDDTDASIDEDDDDKADDEPIVISGETDDNNPGTGVGLALGAVAVSAAAVVLAKKRK